MLVSNVPLSRSGAIDSRANFTVSVVVAAGSGLKCNDWLRTQREVNRAKNIASSRRYAASMIFHISPGLFEAYSRSNHCNVARPAAMTHWYLWARQATLHSSSGRIRAGSLSLRRCRMLQRMYIASPSSSGTGTTFSWLVPSLSLSDFFSVVENASLKTDEAMLRACRDTRRPILDASV